jgi:hypothetical protein
MRYWCISTSANNWEICKENKVWGMDARYFVTFKKFLKAGDKAVVYASRAGGKFVAIIEFVGDFYYSEKNLGWRKGEKPFLGPYRIEFKIIREAKSPILISFSTEAANNKAQWSKPNFIDNIVFIADKGRTWNQYLQVSIINITKEDFDTISKAIMEN